MKRENAELFVKVFDGLRETNLELSSMIDCHNDILRFDRFLCITDDYLAVIIDFASALFDITPDFLDWFINENHMGDKGLTCRRNGIDYVIDCPQSFVNFLLLPDSE